MVLETIFDNHRAHIFARKIAFTFYSIHLMYGRHKCFIFKQNKSQFMVRFTKVRLRTESTKKNHIATNETKETQIAHKSPKITRIWKNKFNEFHLFDKNVAIILLLLNLSETHSLGLHSKCVLRQLLLEALYSSAAKKMKEHFFLLQIVKR